MELIRSKVVKGPKLRNGKRRKLIRVPDLYYEDFEFGEKVEINKIYDKNNVRVPNPDSSDPKPNQN